MCVLLPTYYACGGDPTGHGYIGLEFRNGETCPLYPDCYNPVYRGWPIHDAPQFRQALCPECAPVRGQGRGDDLGEMAGNGSPGFAAPRFGVARGSPPGRIPPETAFHHYTWPGYGPPGARVEMDTRNTIEDTTREDTRPEDTITGGKVLRVRVRIEVLTTMGMNTVGTLANVEPVS